MYTKYISLPCSGRREARKPFGANAALPEQMPHTAERGVVVVMVGCGGLVKVWVV